MTVHRAPRRRSVQGPILVTAEANGAFGRSDEGGCAMAKGFELFMNEEPELAKAYGGMVM